MIFLEQVVSSTVVAAIVAGLFLLGQAIVNRRLRTPADQQSEVEFGVRVLREQISKAERDATRWDAQEQYLRDELRKSDADKDRIYELLQDAREQIDDLRAERDELTRRLTVIAAKVAQGEPVTLSDITGHSVPDDIEDTVIPARE